MELLKTTLESIRGLDRDAMEKAQEKLDNKAKPIGGLGRLEDLAVQIAGIRGGLDNHIDRKNIVVFASDNGIVEEGVSASPQVFTRILTENMDRGMTGVSVLARKEKADITIVDIGLKGEVEGEHIIDRKIRNSSSNFTKGPSMTYEEAIRSIEIGIEIGDKLYAEGYNILGTGELGIGNTTTSAAILSVFSGLDLDKIVGKGAGITDEQYENKKRVIERGIGINKPNPDDPIDVLAKLGGFDIGGLCGVYLSSAKNRLPVVIDGFISSAAALVASRLSRESRDYMIASHLSKEPGAIYMMEELGLSPMLDLEMRLGEGSGCPLAFSLIESSLAIINEMASFEMAKIDKTRLVDIR